MSRKKLAIFSILSIFLLLSAWFYWGFFFPDPQALGPGGLASGVPPLLLLIWIGVPAVALTLFLLMFLAWSGRVATSSLVILFLGGAIAFFLGYPFASEFYYHRLLSKDLSQFHSLLQLKPPQYSPARDASTRIVFLGGSTTAWGDSAGIGWTDRVNEKLKDQFPNEKLDVANEAKEWFTSQHSLTHFSANIRHHHPNIVVVMHAINDLLVNADFSSFSIGPFREDYGHFLGPMRDIIRPHTLLGYFRTKMDAFWYHQPREVITPEFYPGLTPFRRNLTTLNELVRSSGGTLIVMNQPNLYRGDLNPEELEKLYMLNVEAVGENERWSFAAAQKGMKAYNQASREVAEQEGIVFIDLESIVPKSLEFFTDDVHYTDKAFPLIADRVSQSVAQLIPRK
ncbi:MAG: SGNH/GDSL hydrolase family protein [Bdellovibrionales bacterium]|nr:SGNH/GDSL hydrolase family protein [Bdellovibrionales bacterium]